MSDDAAKPEAPDEPVPKLPRGRGLKFSGPELFRIALTLLTLIGVIVLARPCANSVSNFVMGYEQGSATAKLPKPDNVGPPDPSKQDPSKFEHLKPGMTEEELKAAVERAKARNAGSASGSASVDGSAGSAQ